MARVVVLGGAESGVGAAVLAKVKGFDVFLSDNGNIKDEYAKMLRDWDIPFEQGGHTADLILNADEVVKSPGIPSTAPMVKALAAQGTHIVSEIEFASRYDSARKIWITGSRWMDFNNGIRRIRIYRSIKPIRQIPVSRHVPVTVK